MFTNLKLYLIGGAIVSIIATTAYLSGKVKGKDEQKIIYAQQQLKIQREIEARNILNHKLLDKITESYNQLQIKTKLDHQKYTEELHKHAKHINATNTITNEFVRIVSGMPEYNSA